MTVNPFVLARTLKVVQDAQQEIANMQTKDRAATREFVGKETEVVDDMMRDKELEVSKILGKRTGGMGGIQALGTTAMFMNPLTSGIVSGISSLIGGNKQRKHALRQIDKAMTEIRMPEKYAQSWLGKRTKAFEHGYKTKLEGMKSSLPSSSDIFKSALMSGIGSYIMGGGKKEMAKVKAAKAAGADVGLFTGGLDLWGDGTVSSPDTRASVSLASGLSPGIASQTWNIGKPLFGQGNLLEKIFSADKITNREMAQLSPLLNLLNFKR